MDLRPRGRQTFSGFTKSEVEKLEQLLKKTKEQCLEEEFCKKWSKQFNLSSGRAGKPILKWTEIQSWFQKNQQCSTVKETSFDGGEKSHVSPELIYQNKAKENPKMTEGKKGDIVSTLEFEARSSDDGAWYDVDTFLSHRSLDSGDIEVLVRYVGFGEEEDEWVSVKDSVRERSVPLEHSECQKVRVGDLVLCFQESEDQARYYDAHVLEIQRRLHDIRGCRCLYLIKYDHDNTEERVRLRRLCIRPNIVAQLEKH